LCVFKQVSHGFEQRDPNDVEEAQLHVHNSASHFHEEGRQADRQEQIVRKRHPGLQSVSLNEAASQATAIHLIVLPF